RCARDWSSHVSTSDLAPKTLGSRNSTTGSKAIIYRRGVIKVDICGSEVMGVVTAHPTTIGRNMLIGQLCTSKSRNFTFVCKLSVVIRLSTDSMADHIRIATYQRSTRRQCPFHNTVVYLCKPVDEVTDIIGILAIECSAFSTLVFQIILY